MGTVDTNTLVVLVGVILAAVDLLIHVFVVGFRLRDSVKKLIDDSTTETAAAFAELKEELKEELAGTKAELAKLNGELAGTKAELAKLRKDLDGTKEELQQGIDGLVTSERLAQTDARLGAVIACLGPVLRALGKLGLAGEEALKAATALDQASADQQGGSGEDSR